MATRYGNHKAPQGTVIQEVILTQVKKLAIKFYPINLSITTFKVNKK